MFPLRALLSFLILPGVVAGVVPRGPALAQTFGEDGRAYRARVPRWLPRPPRP